MYSDRASMRRRVDNDPSDIEADRAFLAWLRTATLDEVRLTSRRAKKWSHWRKVALARALDRLQKK